MVIKCCSCSLDNQWSVLAVAAVAAAGVEYESVGKPILTIQEAIAAGSFFEYDKKPTVVGDAECTSLRSHIW